MNIIQCFLFAGWTVRMPKLNGDKEIGPSGRGFGPRSYIIPGQDQQRDILKLQLISNVNEGLFKNTNLNIKEYCPVQGAGLPDSLNEFINMPLMLPHTRRYCPVQGAALPDSLDEFINIPLMLLHSTGSGKRQYFLVAILNSIWYSGISCSNAASESIGEAIFE
uniref:DUF927 domain-containing protein n=1 Tax=Parastrongyloides trichosuri TaxID=131310 RepID=A0A0N5A7J6_PARTI